MNKQIKLNYFKKGNRKSLKANTRKENQKFE